MACFHILKPWPLPSIQGLGILIVSREHYSPNSCYWRFRHSVCYRYPPFTLARDSSCLHSLRHFFPSTPASHPELPNSTHVAHAFTQFSRGKDFHLHILYSSLAKGIVLLIDQQIMPIFSIKRVARKGARGLSV